MLLSFRVRNYRSIRDEQELSLVRSRRIAAHRPGPDSTHLRISPVAGIYGGNASGKSNLLLALHAMQRAVTQSHSRWTPGARIPYDPYRLDRESPTLPTRFEVEIQLDDVRYQYGYEFDADKIVAEWLYAYPHGRRQTWFERDTSRRDTWYFGKGLGGHNKVTANVTRPNSLFLSAAATLQHKNLSEIFHWFEAHLRTITPGNFQGRLQYTFEALKDRSGLRDRVTALLRSADLGICGLEVTQRKFEPQERERFLRIARAMADEDDVKPPADEVEAAFERAGTTVRLMHACVGGSDPVGLDFESESLGTRTLLAMLGPVIQAVELGNTILVDEIDTSLHPRLVAEIIRLFQNPTANPKNAQLIFSSHDTSLLGNLVGEEPVLERDQVWFVEKDRDGSSAVYALTDFSPRRNENLERGYLQGRYGAVPFINDSELASAITSSGSDS